jgi:glycosyltransferase involved in cell wall biosynthesis
VSVVLTVCNRWDNLARSLESLRGWLLRQDRVVIVDYDSDDWPLMGRPSSRLFVVHRERPFRRAAGLNYGAQFAEDVVLFTDADILYPADMRERLLAAVKPGECFFPICHNLDSKGEPEKNEGRTGGYGICAFQKVDFMLIGGWDEKYVEWGKEDRDLWDRAGSLKRCRERVPGLFHKHHPTDKEYLNRYY